MQHLIYMQILLRKICNINFPRAFYNNIRIIVNTHWIGLNLKCIYYNQNDIYIIIIIRRM